MRGRELEGERGRAREMEDREEGGERENQRTPTRPL